MNKNLYVLGFIFIFILNISLISAINITTCSELQNINNDLTADYILLNDIDCSDTINWNDGAGFDPIGYGGISEIFIGSFDGQGYTINDLFINSSEVAALFDAASGNISNVGLENVTIIGVDWGAGLIGNMNYNENNIAYINNCFVNGGTIFGATAGGLIGDIYVSTAVINNSWANVTTTGLYYTGGLVGEITTEQYNVNIYNSYSIGSVIDAEGYSGDGGFVGFMDGNVNIISSYWNTETSNQSTSAGGIGKTTSEMKTESTFTDWDFVDTWQMCNDIINGYPSLRVFGECPVSCITNWQYTLTPATCPNTSYQTKIYTVDLNNCNQSVPNNNNTQVSCIYISPTNNEQTYNGYTTTNLNNVSDMTNVTNFTVASSVSAVQWVEPVNLENVTNLAEVVVSTNTIIAINVSAVPSLNSTAYVVLTVNEPSIFSSGCEDFRLYYTSGYYTTLDNIIANGQLVATNDNIGGDCTDPTICTNVQCINGQLMFTAQHFDGFGVGLGTPEGVASCQSTRGSIFAAFALMALFVMIGAAFLIINLMKDGSFDSSIIIASVIGLIAVAIVIFVGYLIISQVSTSICVI